MFDLLPLDRELDRLVLDGEDGRLAVISVSEHQRTVALTIEPFPHGAEYAHRRRLVLALAHPASCTIDERACGPLLSPAPTWNLRSDDGREDGPFKVMLDWLDRALAGHDLAEPDDPQLRFRFEQPGSMPTQRDARRARYSVNRLCELASERAIELCDVASCQAARSLRADARFFAYAAQLSDSTGRVREMIAMCPGLFTLGAMCAPDSERVRALVAGIQARHEIDELAELMLPVAIGERPEVHLVVAAAEVLRSSPPLIRADLCAALRGAARQRRPAATQARATRRASLETAAAFVPGPRTTLLAEHVCGAIGRRAEIVVTDDGRTMAIVATVDNGEAAGSAWHYRRALHVELSLQAPASCTIDGLSRGAGIHAHEGWDLESGDSRDGGPFKDAYWWLSDQLWDADLPGCMWSRPAPAAYTSGEGCHAKLDEILQQAARRAIEICDADARAVALRYPRDARFFVYAALIDDPTGRVRQMIDVCPNLLTLAAACDRDARDIIEGVRVGRKLGELLASAVQSAARHCWTRNPHWLTSAAMAFVRRLPLLALEDLLDLLHAPGIDVNDLPTEAEAIMRWVNIMVTWARAARDVADREVAKKLGGFYSKHGLTARSLGFEVEAFSAIIDWLHRTSAPIPTRRSSPHQVIRAVERWHETLYREVEYAPETPLAKAPVPDRSVAGIDATPLETVGALVAEGKAMRHCVAMSACHAVAGTQFIYSARIDDARVTIAVSGTAGNWRLVEAAGFANRQLEVHEQIAIERWLAALPKRSSPT